MDIIVLPQDGMWTVKRENSEEILSEHESKKEAIETAKEIAMGQDAGIVILRADGTIDNLGVYGVDPFPSEDRGPEFNNEQDEGV